MSEATDLAAILEAVTAEIDSLGLVVYPGVLRVTDPAPGVRWKGDDWSTFLLLGSQLGTRVIYVGLESVADELERIDDYYRDDLLQLVAEHGPGPTRLTVGYVLDGVPHVWWQRADWVTYDDEPDYELEKVRDAEYEELAAEAEREGWADELLAIPAFCLVDLRDRSAIVESFLRDKGIDVSPDSAGQSLVGWLVHSTRRHISERRGQAIDAALSLVPEMAQQVIERDPEWMKLRVAMRERKAAPVVAERFGVAVPLVVQEVARWKPDKG